MSEPTPQPGLPPVLYGLFAGQIDQLAVQRFHNAITIASQNGARELHLLFQCSGGFVGDGISLYNLFRVSPVELTIYNAGSISSIGVIAYLGAKNRKASKHSAFMIHKAYLNPAIGGADRLVAAVDHLRLEDQRIESILKEHSNIPAEKWEMHKYADVWLSANDAAVYGICEIGEFAPPLGSPFFNVWPPQN